MDLAKRAIFFMTMVAVFRPSMSIVHKVGDSIGWTSIANFDYQNWAASRAFHVHDIILFEFDPQNHNVMQVNLSDFHSCNTNSPIATYSTGNDSIIIRSYGHYHFICGFPGHCQAGVKIDIRVPKIEFSVPKSPN